MAAADDRRYALMSRLDARDTGLDAIESLYLWRQTQIASAALPANFPALEKLWYPPGLCLAAVERIEEQRWYTTTADVVGATQQEFENIGLTPREAADVVAAAANL